LSIIYKILNNYGSAGTGSTNHLTGELLKLEAGINIMHVPFKGGAPAMAALLANEVELYIATVPTIMPMVHAGRIRAIAVSSEKRASSLPDVPTIAKSGFPGFDATSWFCVVGPAGIPRPIVDRLNAEITKILNKIQS
jgi:tripartite-type tricarboxylate transporter receptor subunit TctC